MTELVNISRNNSIVRYKKRNLLSVTKNLLNKDLNALWLDKLLEFFKKYNIEEYQNMSKEDLKNLVSLTLKYKKQRARKVKKFFTNIKWQINLSFNLKDLQYQYNTFWVQIKKGGFPASRLKVCLN